MLFAIARRPWFSLLLDDDTGGGGGAPATPPVTSTDATTPPVTSTDATKVAGEITKAADAARKATEAQIAETLGVPIAEAKKIVDAAQAKERAAMSDAERAKADAAEDRAAAASERSEAARIRREAEVTAALAARGISDKAQQRDLVRLVEIPADTAADDLEDLAAAEVEKLVERYPALFAAGGAPKPPRTPSTTTPGAPKPPGAPGSKSALDRGKERAATEFADRVVPTTYDPNPFARPNV